MFDPHNVNYTTNVDAHLLLGTDSIPFGGLNGDLVGTNDRVELVVGVFDQRKFTLTEQSTNVKMKIQSRWNEVTTGHAHSS